MTNGDFQHRHGKQNYFGGNGGHRFDDDLPPPESRLLRKHFKIGFGFPDHAREGTPAQCDRLRHPAAPEICRSATASAARRARSPWRGRQHRRERRVVLIQRDQCLPAKRRQGMKVEFERHDAVLLLRGLTDVFCSRLYRKSRHAHWRAAIYYRRRGASPTARAQPSASANREGCVPRIPKRSLHFCLNPSLAQHDLSALNS
jgi:hypothetical protein